jgi:hypothetical protein
MVADLFRKTSDSFFCRKPSIGGLIKAILELGENFWMSCNEILCGSTETTQEKTWNASLNRKPKLARNAGAASNRLPPFSTNDHNRVASRDDPLPEQFQACVTGAFSQHFGSFID